jgi:hypothetical protein
MVGIKTLTTTAARATAMATSRHRTRRRVGILTAAALLGTGVASLSSIASSSPGSRVTDRGTRTAGAQVADAFSWLRAGPSPKTWTSATIVSGGATLSYPSNWKPIPGDHGTVTAALRDSRGLYRGYLNVTPRQGAEQLAGWATFRIERNTQEGDRQTRVVASAENLRLGSVRGSCVIDDYLSRVESHPYRELACIFTGSRYTNVFVGASLVRDWPTLGRVVERAASAFTER